MNPLNLSSRIRLALVRTAMRAAGYLLRKAIEPALTASTGPAPATARANSATGRTETGRVFDGEYRRVDPRHNNNW